MAIVICKECNKEVSDKAKKCVHCGAVLIEPKRGFFGSLFMVVFILFNAVMLWATWTAVNIASGGYGESAAHNVGEGLAVGAIIMAWIIGGLFLGMFVALTKPK